jgi:hypothetical protein
MGLLDKFRWKPDQEESQPVEETVTPTQIERFTLKTGESYLLWQPRIRYQLDGRYANGQLVTEDGKLTDHYRLIDYSIVEQHVVVGMTSVTGSLRDMPGEPPRSLQL